MGDAAHQTATTMAIQATYSHHPVQEAKFAPVVMWVRFSSSPVIQTMVVWMKMNPTKIVMKVKWTMRAVWRLTRPQPRPNLAAIAGACSRPVMNASGAAMKTMMKYERFCSPLYCVQPRFFGKCSDPYWMEVEVALVNTLQFTGTRRA